MKKILDYFLHESSVVDEGAEIGSGTKIWHFSHVSSRAIIGDNVTIGQNVFVGSTATIGSNCKIQNNVSVYDGVSLEEDVFVGPSVVFTNVNNPRARVNRKKEYKETRVLRGASIGANATIVCGSKIGEYAFIAAGAVVKGNVKNYALMVGVPAVQKGWIDQYGERIDLPLEGNASTKCLKTGTLYRLIDGQIEVKE